MTVEEAVERILAGGPWLFCIRCDGNGYVRIEGGKGTDQCPVCDGFVSIMDPDYHEACRILGKELPYRPIHSRALKPERVTFPTFEIADGKPDLAPYSLRLTQMLDDAKRESIEEIDRGIIFDDD